MMGQLMKAVKRGNKKRGINITIGAVIGFLLSCTAVMGEGLEITQKTRKEILFNEMIYDETTHPFKENTFENNIYTNNMRIEDNSSEGNTGCGLFIGMDENFGLEVNNDGLILGSRKGYNQDGYGVWNYGSEIEKISNNGLIVGEGQDYGGGIWNYSGTINNIENKGIIYGNSDNNAFGIRNEKEGIIGKIDNSGKIVGVVASQSRGIYNTGTITEIENTGIIYGNGNRGLGIWNQGKIESIDNSGIIIGIGNNGEAYGIQNNLTSSNLMKNIKNTGKIISLSQNSMSCGIPSNNPGVEVINPVDNLGMIIGKAKSSGSGTGFYSESTGDKINNLGIIYGSTNALGNSESDAGVIKGNNYGLLIGGIKGVTIENAGTGEADIKNYGIAFIEIGGSYIISHRYDKTEDITVDMFSKKREMKVKNAVTSTIGSNSFSEKTYENSIVNGITDTIKISGTGNTIKGSVVNAYTSAIKFGNTENNSLTISGSIINGGLDDSGTAIKGESNIKGEET